MKRTAVVLLTALALLAAPAVYAGDGHTLHGVGAVNSSMGGAGVALPIDTLGGLLLNPALATEQDGSHFAFSAEYNTPTNAVSSTVPTPIGPFSGKTDEAGDTALIPAFGFVHHTRGSNFAYGIGFLGLAGFGTDYPQDPGNPLLAPQPNGFGRVFSSYTLLKVPTVLAWKLSDRFSFGLSLNAARATLAADPAGFASPDCSGPFGPCYFPQRAPTRYTVAVVRVSRIQLQGAATRVKGGPSSRTQSSRRPDALESPAAVRRARPLLTRPGPTV